VPVLAHLSNEDPRAAAFSSSKRVHESDGSLEFRFDVRSPALLERAAVRALYHSTLEREAVCVERRYTPECNERALTHLQSTERTHRGLVIAPNTAQRIADLAESAAHTRRFN
jgi:hypothetical protein